MLAEINFQNMLAAHPLASEFSVPMQGTVSYVDRQRTLLSERAKQYLAQSVPRLTFEDFTAYGKNGKRADYDAHYYDRRGRLMVFALMAWLEPENETWLSAFCDIVWDICAEPFWCIPAHFYDEKRAPLDFGLYANHLDLFSCETAFALAEADALLAERLPEMIRRQIRLSVQRRVFDTWLNDKRRFFFEKYPNNWASVCAGSIGGAALYLLPDGQELHRILHRCMACIDVYFSSFGADGVCLEGAGYFSYGFGFFTCFADLLNKRSHGQIDLFVLQEKAKVVAMSQHWFYISGRTAVNFADTREDVKCRMGISQHLLDKIGAPIPSVAEDVLDDTCYRFCLAVRDLAWTHHESPASQTSEAVWLEQAQWFLSRHDSLALAAKGGCNGQSHGHNDCGSLIVFANGESCICDPGAGQYTAAYFSPKRYEFLTTGARGHNVPIINDTFQTFGPTFCARELEVETDTPVRAFSAELSACYPPQANVRRFVRRIVHNTGNDSITLEDTVMLNAAGFCCENFCGREEIVLKPGEAVFSRKGQQVRLCYDEELLKAEIIQDSYIDIDNRNCPVWFLRLHSRNEAASHTIRIEITGK